MGTAVLYHKDETALTCPHVRKLTADDTGSQLVKHGQRGNQIGA